MRSGDLKCLMELKAETEQDDMLNSAVHVSDAKANSADAATHRNSDTTVGVQQQQQPCERSCK